MPYKLRDAPPAVTTYVGGAVKGGTGWPANDEAKGRRQLFLDILRPCVYNLCRFAVWTKLFGSS
jgi:hypothetical protein